MRTISFAKNSEEFLRPPNCNPSPPRIRLDILSMNRDTIEGGDITEKNRPLKCMGKLCNAKMAVVYTCPASSGAVAPIILQVLLGDAFGIYFQSGGKNQKLESIPT